MAYGYGALWKDIEVSDILDKWGAEVAGRGFAQVPNYLLLLNQFLSEEKKLSPAELLVLIQLVGTWWHKDEMPFPALKTLATRCGISDRQAQRSVSRLEEINLIKRVKRKDRGMIASNAYDLSPLVRFLGAVAKAFPNEFVRKVQKDELAKLDQFLEEGVSEDEAQEPEAKPAKPNKRLRLKRAVNLED